MPPRPLSLAASAFLWPPGTPPVKPEDDQGKRDKDPPSGLARRLTSRGSRQATPRPVPDKDGWVPLFNGEDLTWWKTHSGTNRRVERLDGVLVGKANDGGLDSLFSERGDYENFHFRAEVKVRTGNSGLSSGASSTPAGEDFPERLPCGNPR